MDFIHKRTSEISTDDRQSLCSLFKVVFEKEMTNLQFKKKFVDAPLGYSYHGLMVDGGNIVGAYSAIPYRYQYFGQERTFALSVDTMIHPEHRGGPYNVKKMAELVYSALKSDNIPFVFGFPNKNIFDYRLKVLKWHHLGDLDFFFLPLRIGALKPSIAWLNQLSQVGAACFVHLPEWSKDRKSDRPIVKVGDEAFRNHRYDSAYKHLDISDTETCIVRIHVEDNGTRVAYIIDISPLTTSTFKKAVKKVYDHVKSKADVIMYIGKLDFVPKCLLKVPKSLEPKPVQLCGKILLPDKIDERVLDISNWHVNLSNFDVR